MERRRGPPSNHPKKQSKSYPAPKRGQIKAQIFHSFAATISSMAHKTGEALVRIKNNSAARIQSSTITPPLSPYTSGGCSDDDFPTG
nr:Transcriptional regulator like [Ipomoea trifida]